MDWIQGERFKALARFTYAPRIKTTKDDYDNLQNTLDITLLNDGDIVYTHMMYACQLFNLLGHLSKKVIVITHSCDCSVEQGGIRRPDGHGNGTEFHSFTIPDNVIKWYSKNVNVVDSRIESIPIGLENNMWHEKLRVNKLKVMLNQLAQHRGVRNLVYLNHRIKNNAKQRQILYDLFEKEPWVTAKYGGNGYQFDRYIHQIYNHKFVFSPEGNGMDTIRTWECLYMGTIPIEKRNINNQFYKDLPICFVDDWKEVTVPFLNMEYERIKSLDWNMEKLTFGYWRDKILST